MIQFKEYVNEAITADSVIAEYSAKGYTIYGKMEDARGNVGTVLSRGNNFVFVKPNSLKSIGKNIRAIPDGWKMAKKPRKQVVRKKKPQPDLDHMKNLLKQSYKRGGPLADHERMLTDYLGTYGLYHIAAQRWLEKFAKANGERFFGAVLQKMEDDFYTL